MTTSTAVTYTHPSVLAGIAALLIAVLTVSFQSVKAALTNPVKSLRSE